MLPLLLLACAIRTDTHVPPGTPADAVPWLDRADYPFTSRFFPADGGQMHYIDEGSGPPVVFVHGTPTWSYEWRHQIQALRADHRVIALDHVGFGLSEKPLQWAYTPEAHARNAAALLDSLDLRGATVVLHDFGGPIGLPWALDNLDRVDHLVLMNTWGWSLEGDERFEKASRMVAGPLGRYLYLKRNASPRKLIPWSVGEGFAADAAFLQPYTAPFPDPQRRQAAWQLGVELIGSSGFYDGLWARLSSLQSEDVTLLWGMQDPAFPADFLDRWREALPDAAVIELPDAGHFPQEERPQAVTEAIRAVSAGS